MLNNKVIQAFEIAQQSHIFKNFKSLSLNEQNNLIEQASSIDIKLVNDLVQKLILNSTNESKVLKNQNISPPKIISLSNNKSNIDNAQKIGESYLNSNNLAILTVAGGHATRLGLSSPKGTLSITPIKEKSLFQVFAEKIINNQFKYKNSNIYWFIMTSKINHNPTIDFFKKNNYFGLDPNNIKFFQQNEIPILDFNGKIIMENSSKIYMSPDGHGGSFYALKNHGLLDFMVQKNIHILSYHQIDNPMAKTIDPSFIGFHIQNKSDFSSKSVTKNDLNEKVGLFCTINQKLHVIEYNNLSAAINQDLKFNAANIAIHLFNRSFIEKITNKNNIERNLPFHKAIKKICIVKNEINSKPTYINSIRFERFIFDALSLAENPILIETQRDIEFSPVKNKNGADSLETCLLDQINLFKSWIFGLLPKENFNKIKKIEISPLFADSKKEFLEKWKLHSKNVLINDGQIYIE